MNRLPSGAWGHGFFQTDAIQRRLRRALPIDDWRDLSDSKTINWSGRLVRFATPRDANIEATGPAQGDTRPDHP